MGTDYYMKISETQDGAIYKRVMRRALDKKTERVKYTPYALADSEPVTFFRDTNLVDAFFHYRGGKVYRWARSVTHMPVDSMSLEVRTSEQMRLWLAELPAGRSPEEVPVRTWTTYDG
jgi:hypothetical protein